MPPVQYQVRVTATVVLLGILVFTAIGVSVRAVQYRPSRAPGTPLELAIAVTLGFGLSLRWWRVPPRFLTKVAVSVALLLLLCSLLDWVLYLLLLATTLQLGAVPFQMWSTTFETRAQNIVAAITTVVSSTLNQRHYLGHGESSRSIIGYVERLKLSRQRL